MSNKKLKKHRKEHGLRIPCPLCKEFRPREVAVLVVKHGTYTTYYNDLMWDGANPYLNKEISTDYRIKNFFELQCSNNACTLRCTFKDETELNSIILPYIETLLEDLADVPSPPQHPTLPIIKQGKKKKWVLKLVQRKDREKKDLDAVLA